ncbi:MAG: acylphosphatase [Nitrospirae bacterium]|nr:acylphosphatase [Nitrospirota bacterium]
METVEEKIRAQLTIEGRVQGVCFRAFTRDIARRSDVRGWVKNLPNGDVEVVLEGSKKDVGVVIANCYKGPPGSLVTNISIKWERYTGQAPPFSITY